MIQVDKKKREKGKIHDLSSATYSVDILFLYSENGDGELPNLTVEDNMDKWRVLSVLNSNKS